MEQQKLEQRPEIRRLIEASQDHKLMTQSLVNYAAAPIGAKKYDSNWLASNAAH